jgi:hypothetical protein
MAVSKFLVDLFTCFCFYYLPNFVAFIFIDFHDSIVKYIIVKLYKIA